MHGPEDVGSQSDIKQIGGGLSKRVFGKNDVMGIDDVAKPRIVEREMVNIEDFCGSALVLVNGAYPSRIPIVIVIGVNESGGFRCQVPRDLLPVPKQQVTIAITCRWIPGHTGLYVIPVLR